MASPPAKWAKHYGEYLVGNLPTMYTKAKCNSCSEEYMTVFGVGETQPGKMECVVSGVWRVI